MNKQLLDSMQQELKYKFFTNSCLKNELNERISKGDSIEHINEVAILIKENNEAYDLLSSYIESYKEQCLKLDTESDTTKLEQIKAELKKIEELFKFQFDPEPLSS